MSLLVIILQHHIIAFLQFLEYWNKAALPSGIEKGRRFMTFHDVCTTSSEHVL